MNEQDLKTKKSFFSAFQRKQEVTEYAAPASEKTKATSRFALLAFLKLAIGSPFAHFLLVPIFIALIGLVPTYRLGYSPNPNPYDNVCGFVPVGQNWCLDPTDNYWTKFTPTTSGTGSCGATGTYTGTCVTYIAEQGTGTLATCRVAATPGFSFLTDPTNGGVNMANACPYQETYMSGARTGTNDYLLFRRGDCFVDPGQISPCLGTVNSYTTSWGVCTAHGVTCNWGRNGLDGNNYMVIGAFGPLANARPSFITINTCVQTQSGTGNYIAVIDLACDVAKPKDYKNPVYNPGIFTAAAPVTGGTGVTTITLNSAPSTAILQSAALSGGGWYIYNFDNPTEMRGAGSGASGMKVTSIAGTVVTLNSQVPSGWDIATGDRLIFQPFTANGFSFNATALTTYYLEGNYLEGGAIGHNPIISSALWPNGNLLNAYIRRNVIFQSSSVVTRNQGGFFGDTFNPNSTILVEENVFDHTGWRQVDADCVPDQFMPAKCGGVGSEQYENFYGNPNSQSQNSYDHENCCIATFRRNINTNGSGSGIQVRSGGILYNNLIARNGNAATGGAIVTSNTASYNTFSKPTNSYCAILQARGVSGNTITFDYFPQSIWTGTTAACTGIPFNASNPSGISQSISVSAAANSTLAWSGGIVTVTTAAPHGIPVGDLTTVTISGAVPTAYNVTGVIATSTGASTLTYALVSNPGAISTPGTYTKGIFSFTKTTVTIAGAAISVSTNDWIYFTASGGPQSGYIFNSANSPAGAPVPPNAVFPSDVQWNIALEGMSSTVIGQGLQGFGFSTQVETVRSVGNTMKNNYMVALSNQGIQDLTQITGINGTSCTGAQAGQVGISMNRPSSGWVVGDSIVIAGALPSSMNANGTFTVSFVNGTGGVGGGELLCLAGSTFGTGAWTSGTGTVNGGVDWGTGSSANKYYSVPTPSTTTPSLPSTFTPQYILTGGGASCPQAANCASIESYDLSIGGDGTLSHFVSGARNNRKGSWDSNYTAAPANNYIRLWTDTSIPRPPL